MTIPQRIALTLIAFGQIAMLAWLVAGYYEQPWLQYPNLPLKVEQRIYRTGEPVLVHVERCNLAEESRAYLITLYLVSYDFPKREPVAAADVTRVPAEKGCTTYVNKIRVIPNDVIPGRYILKGQAYVEGRIRSRWIDWYTEPFTVGK